MHQVPHAHLVRHRLSCFTGSACASLGGRRHHRRGLPPAPLARLLSQLGTSGAAAAVVQLAAAAPPSLANRPVADQPTSDRRVGCGKHIDTALEGVPEEQRCHCKAYSQAQHDADNGGVSCCQQ